MSSNGARDVRVRVENLSKTYSIWRRPSLALVGRVHGSLAGSTVLPARARAYCRKRAEGSAQRFEALSGLTFDVHAGESWGILGPNGSGKSTLLQILAGTLAPSSGQVEVNGKVGAVLELGCGFHPEFTGRENVTLAASLLGPSRRGIEAQHASIESFADIGAFFDQPVKTYSTGMLMRLAFATAVSVDADVLAIDEALSVGDAGFQFKCLDHLQRQIRSGVTVLLVSHDIVAIRALCNRALYLEGGRCRAIGAIDEVAECYLKDVRDQQRRSAGAPSRLLPKPSVGVGALPSFGAREGCISEAFFTGTEAARRAVAPGEPVSIDVEVRLEAGLSFVHLGLLILNDHRIPIAGRRARLTGDGPLPSEPYQCRARFEFAASLTPGTYFINLRLEYGPSPTTSLLLEKQTGALELEVLADGREDRLGAFDLAMTVTTEIATGHHASA